MLLVLLVLSATSTARAATFTVTVDQGTITVGDDFQISLNFDGGQPDSDPSLPAIPGLQIISQQTSQNVSISNGRQSIQISYILLTRALRAGDYTIPAITVSVDGQRVTSSPVKLKVIAAQAPPPGSAAEANQQAFARLVLPKKEFYVGEVIVAELQLYTRTDLQTGGSQLPAIPVDGFNLGKTVVGRPHATTVANVPFNVQPVSIVLTAFKTGPATVGPVTIQLAVSLPPRNINEQFFGRRGQLNVTAPAETASCKPLPTANRPANFNGAVGSFELNVSAGPTNVATGDPITVRVQISGRGALEAINVPEQSTWTGFKLYPTSSHPPEFTDALGVQGSRTFEQIISPETANVKELPPFNFSFFDPDARQYRTLTYPAVALVVRPGGNTMVPTIATIPTRNDAAAPTQDIVHIKPRAGTLGPVRPPLIQQPWFLAAQGLPFCVWLVALGWRKRSDALANNPRLRRQRALVGLIQNGLKELHELAAANDSDQFFATLFRLLQEQLGERLDCPASAITEAVVDDKLRPQRVAESVLTELRELFQSCNQARYAPIKSSQELAAVIPRVEAVLRELRNVKL